MSSSFNKTCCHEEEDMCECEAVLLLPVTVGSAPGIPSLADCSKEPSDFMIVVGIDTFCESIPWW